MIARIRRSRRKKKKRRRRKKEEDEEQEEEEVEEGKTVSCKIPNNKHSTPSPLADCESSLLPKQRTSASVVGSILTRDSTTQRERERER